MRPCRALDFGPELSAEQRADTAVKIAEAKFLTDQVSLEVASRLFEIQGARATTAAYGFDRHWRNLRTHTVHDPVAYKAREIGDWSSTSAPRSSRCTADFRAGTRVFTYAGRRARTG